ncbi:hypothetical protein AgCh_009941 [Apium graveolens]
MIGRQNSIGDGLLRTEIIEPVVPFILHIYDQVASRFIGGQKREVKDRSVKGIPVLSASFEVAWFNEVGSRSSFGDKEATGLDMTRARIGFNTITLERVLELTLFGVANGVGLISERSTS